MFKVNVFNLKEMPKELDEFTKVLPYVIEQTEIVDSLSESDKKAYVKIADKARKDIVKSIVYPICSVLMDLMNFKSNLPKTKDFIEQEVSLYYDHLSAEAKTIEEIESLLSPSENGFSLLIETYEVNGIGGFSPIMMTYTFMNGADPYIFDVTAILHSEINTFTEILYDMVRINKEAIGKRIKTFTGTQSEFIELANALSETDLNEHNVNKVIEETEMRKALKMAKPSAIMN